MPYKNRVLAKAQRRNREHIRRSAVSDITAAQELAMRHRARACPLCGVRLTAVTGQPNSKHLDHILPVVRARHPSAGLTAGATRGCARQGVTRGRRRTSRPARTERGSARRAARQTTACAGHGTPGATTIARPS